MTNLLITFLASFLIWFMFLGLVILWVIDGRVKKEQALHAFLSSIIAWLVTEMIKSFFPTTRPFVTNGHDPLTITTPTNSAFPSTHAAVAFAIAVTLFLHDKRLGSAFLVSAIVVGAARIISQVHYPFDIFGGAVVGVLIALIVEKLHVARFLSRRR